MAVIKCKMCGGDLRLIEGQSVAECEYCGSRQTVPTADSEKKLTLFARANRLRASCEFDKAAGVYESIVADFPEEAEAYWGLVLCKYGIEYVDDPATGKKVPTCHRSSFESVLEDSDFEQACENADGIARKVYREEAKEIEEIRKGIIEVSGKEQPYDIFICYKETDENGDRTIDSVIAQDVYDALTDKGYRVFFSRITLEDKLGQEYEPYIFAALNSAKIMLAFGTDFEYFNAVWVKNEWSRYLKLMASDKSKHLIPCYKGIDAYDMPKEFAKLQAQDMGKVGAIQDLLRGIEKLLPKAAPVTVVQERVVVGGGGNNKIASLLDRGNMALEDGDWAKADSFFEDVLNNDSKNAQAYLGKALAGEKCCTLDALVRERKDATQKIQGEKLKLAADEAHISEMVQKYSLPGYVSQDEIRRLYTFDLSYYSEVPGRKRQYENTEHYWTEHKQLSRAEKFAVGPVAENLAQEKKALFSTLSFRVKSAEQAEKLAKKDLQSRYEAHLRQADGEAEKRYRGGCARREADYQKWVKTAQSSADVAELTEAAQGLEGLGAYSDSAAMAERCRQRAAEEQAKQETDAFEALGNYKDSQDRISEVRYTAAEALLTAGSYDEAIAAFQAMDGYKDSAQQIETCKNAKMKQRYDAAMTLFISEDYEQAKSEFLALGDFSDSAAMAEKCGESIRNNADQTVLDEGIAAYERGDYSEALKQFDAVKDFGEASQWFEKCEQEMLSSIEIGQHVLFGRIEQDGDSSTTDEPIEWIVVDQKDDTYLLYSKYSIMAGVYNTEKGSVTWETCTLRTDLNSNFLNTAFNDAEQTGIQMTTLSNGANPRYGTPGGNNTSDYVFIPSYDELVKYIEIADVSHCPGTPAVCYKSGDGTLYWLRTPGEYSDEAMIQAPVGTEVYDTTSEHTWGKLSSGDYKPLGIRPALWVSKDVLIAEGHIPVHTAE